VSSEAEVFERCMAVHGVAVFGADTVYGLACEPNSKEAVRRLYALKGRLARKPAAVMFFALDLALAALPELDERTRAAVERLLPGPVTLLLPNPAGRWPLACAGDPGTLGLRVPDAAGSPLAAVSWPVLQSSANPAGGPEPRRLDEVAEPIRSGADLLLDAGELPGVPSSVVDLRRFEEEGSFTVLRDGAMSAAEIAARLGA
jgi:L-threonylcarbamoyladenylate synthase